MVPLPYPRTVKYRNEIHLIALMLELYALGSVANDPIGTLTLYPDGSLRFRFKRSDVVDGLSQSGWCDVARNLVGLIAPQKPKDGHHQTTIGCDPPDTPKEWITNRI